MTEKNQAVEKIEEIEEDKRQVPDMQIDAKNKIVYQTHDVPLKINGEEKKVVLRKLNTREKNKITDACTSVKIVGNQQSVKVDHTAIKVKILSVSMIEAPFEISESMINDLPAEVSDYLFGEYNDFAEPSDKKKD